MIVQHISCLRKQPCNEEFIATLVVLTNTHTMFKMHILSKKESFLVDNVS